MKLILESLNIEHMWLISDYDGTLKNGANGTVSSADLEFVKKFIQQGNQFVIASGRAFFQLEEFMKELGLKPNYYIANAGAYILNDQGEIIYGNHIEPNTLTKIIQYLKTVKLESVIFADTKGEYYLFTNSPERDKDLSRPILNQSYDSLMNHQVACFKILDNKEVLDSIVKYLQQEFDDEISLVINTDSNLVEIHPKNSSKGNAVQYLQKKLKIPDNQIIVAGDDDNDISMLDTYKNSFCIRQPYNQRIQNHGQYVINSISEIEKYLN